jgi:hypothetical protein
MSCAFAAFPVVIPNNFAITDDFAIANAFADQHRKRGYEPLRDSICHGSEYSNSNASGNSLEYADCDANGAGENVHLAHGHGNLL